MQRTRSGNHAACLRSRHASLRASLGLVSFYVLGGEYEMHVGDEKFRLGLGDSVFAPRKVPHVWTAVSPSAHILNTYQPAGKIEEFFQALAKFKDLPTREEAINKAYADKQVNAMARLFEAHDMALTGPPLDVE